MSNPTHLRPARGDMLYFKSQTTHAIYHDVPIPSPPQTQILVAHHLFALDSLASRRSHYVSGTHFLANARRFLSMFADFEQANEKGVRRDCLPIDGPHLV
jgi:hypothetical protein